MANGRKRKAEQSTSIVRRVRRALERPGIKDIAAVIGELAISASAIAAQQILDAIGGFVSTKPNNPTYSPTGTTTEEVKKKRRNGNVNTMMSAGKLKMRRVRKTRDSRRQKMGVVTTFEHNATYSNTAQVAYIGHHTHPLEQVRYEMWTIILKTLLNKMNVFPGSRDQTLSILDINAGDIFEVEYRTTPTAPILSATFTVGAATTFNNVISWAGDVTRPWFSGEAQQTTLEKVRFLPSTLISPGASELILSTAVITISSKSHMKVQNRTINSAGNDQSDDVDNVPLYGKGYMCKGNQARIATSVGVIETIIANATNGAVSASSGSGDGLPEEPVQPTYFRNVKAVGKFHLDPAQVKTSTVYAKFRGYVNTLLNQINGIAAGVKRVSVGKTKFFAVEKMINSTPAQPIIVSYEINTTFSSTLKSRRIIGMKPSLFTV